MNRHETDLFSLVFGVVFIAAALTWAVVKLVDIPRFSFGWVFAGGTVLIGLLGVLSALRPRRR